MPSKVKRVSTKKADTRSDRIKRAVQEAEGRHRRQMVERWLRSIPPEYARLEYAELLDSAIRDGRVKPPQLRPIKDFVANEQPPSFILLNGPTGLGKSSLGVMMITERIRATGESAAYRQFPRLLQEFSWPEDRDPLKSASDPPLLFLDDVGAISDSMSSHQAKSLWSLIDARWSDPEKVTVIASNMAVQDNRNGPGLMTLFGESGWDRIAHSLSVVTFSGDSLRIER